MRARQRIRLRYLAAVMTIMATASGAFFYLRQHANANIVPASDKKQIEAHATSKPAVANKTGYKAEDRQKLEQLIHQGAKDD